MTSLHKIGNLNTVFVFFCFDVLIAVQAAGVVRFGGLTYGPDAVGLRD